MHDNQRRLKPLAFHIINNLEEGGAEAVLYRLVTADTDTTHVVISLMGSGKYGQKLIDAGIEVHCLGIGRGIVNLYSLVGLTRMLRCRRPNVVQTWMYHSDLVG